MEIAKLLTRIHGKLKDAGVEQPTIEARVFLRRALGMTDADIITEKNTPVEGAAEKMIDSWLIRRHAGEPLSRILGEREFWSLPFTVTSNVLDPRPDTETVIEAALKILAARPPLRILDLGTGSGCLLITLLHEWPAATGVGIDMSLAALNVAASNAVRNDVAARAVFQQGDWGRGLGEKFDLIVSNPPYIRAGDIPNLEPAVRNFDPIMALDGGESGLDAYIKIVDDVKNLLGPEGAVLLEVGQGQAPDVMRLGAQAGFAQVESYRDLGGIERVVLWRFFGSRGKNEKSSAAPLPPRESGG